MVRILPAVFLGAAATLLIPGAAELELYEIEDFTFGMGGGFPAVDISLATGDQQCYFDLTGMEFADRVGWLAPDGEVTFSNGLLISRATRVQHAAIWTAIAVWRIRTRSLEHLDRAFHRAERALKGKQSAAG